VDHEGALDVEAGKRIGDELCRIQTESADQMQRRRRWIGERP
jgi:hypothetical protein